MKSRAFSFRSQQRLTLASLIVGYMGYYLCRQNFSAAFPLMHAATGLDKKTFGTVASSGTLIYAIGKVVTGPWTDKFGGRKTFFVGLFGSVAATLLLGLAGKSVAALFLLWGTNRFFQSMGWGGLLSVLSRWFSRKDYGTASGMLSVSYQAGGVVAGMVCAALVGFGWRSLFIAPSLMLAALGVALIFTLHGDPSDVGYTSPREGAEAAGVPENSAPLSFGERLAVLLSSRAFLMVCGLSFVLTFIRESFNTWMPTYFSDQGAEASVAIIQSLVFPGLGCVGTLFAGWYSDRYLSTSRGPIMAVFLFGATLSLIGLAQPAMLGELASKLGLPAGAPLVVLVGATGFLILAPYSMVGGGVLALDAGGRRAAATAAGVLDGIGYLGATMAGLGVARVAAQRGWSTAFGTMAVAAFLCALLCVVMWQTAERRRAGPDRT